MKRRINEILRYTVIFISVVFIGIFSISILINMVGRSSVFIVSGLIATLTLSFYLRLCHYKNKINSFHYQDELLGDVVFFLKPKYDKDIPIVMSKINTWDAFITSKPILGLSNEMALKNAIIEIQKFTEINSVMVRFGSALRAGSCVNAMDEGEEKNILMEIFRKSCILTDAEIVSLSEEEKEFI